MRVAKGISANIAEVEIVEVYLKAMNIKTKYIEYIPPRIKYRQGLKIRSIESLFEKIKYDPRITAPNRKR